MVVRSVVQSSFKTYKASPRQHDNTNTWGFLKTRYALRVTQPTVVTTDNVISCRRVAAMICPRPGLQGDHYCMSMLACQYNQPKLPGDFDLLTLKVVC